jgi:hypothetical protein
VSDRVGGASIATTLVKLFLIIQLLFFFNGS